MSANICSLCHGNMEVLNKFSKFKSFVTSDGRIINNAYVTFLRCVKCGHIQKKYDEDYKLKLNSIYTSYSVDPFSIGDQKIYSVNSAQSRFNIIINRLIDFKILPKQGSLLDIGCGRGTFLKKFNSYFPSWYLYGQEYDDHFKDEILSIPKVIHFFKNDDLYSTKEKFTLITLHHVLEHIQFPVQVLLNQLNLLDRDGFHFIQVPSYEKEYFDLIVFDHCHHFSHRTLEFIATNVGIDLISSTDGWTPKHIGWLVY